MKRDFNRWEIAFIGLVVVAGLALRLRLALLTYLNPDEAMHALWAFGTWGDTLSNWMKDTHPPLLLFVTHTVSLISRTELALRLVPVLAGSLFPLLLFAWLRRVAGRIAAMAALFLLTLAPHLVTISAQLRSYTLALLFLSAALVVLEQALEDGRWRTMAAYSVLLWLCILSDYSMSWFAGAAGCYALLRLRGSSALVKATWAIGQLVGLLLYGLLFTTQVRNIASDGNEFQNAASGWLMGSFPRPGSMLAFPAVGTLKQFAYLMASVPLGGLASVLFAVALFWLWTGRTGIERSKARALAVLLVLPFALAVAGAYAHLFPYGRTRHTLVIGVFGAIGIAIFLQTLPRRTAVMLLWGTLLLTPLWQWKADQDPEDISADRNQKELMVQFLGYIRAAIPPGAMIFTERETLMMLAYYEGDNEMAPRPPTGQFLETALGGRWRVAALDYHYNAPEDYRAGLAVFRRHYGLGESEPVWILDGGWSVVSAPPDETRPFTKAIQVFQAGAR